MDMELERGLKTALADIESFRGDDCLDADTLGRYAENHLAQAEKAMVEQHLGTCLYCLKQLNDMSAALHYQRQVKGRQTQRAARQERTTIRERLTDFFSFTPNLWRYSTAVLAAAWLVFIASNLILSKVQPVTIAPSVDPKAFAKVQAFDETGRLRNEVQGVAVGGEGLVASELSPLVGASKLRITFNDGTTKEIDRIWKDDNQNLAVLKTDSDSLAKIPLGDVKEIVGKKIYAVADPSSKKGLQEALASDIKETSTRGAKGARYIQVATQAVTKTKGAIVDEQGRLLGLLITEEQHLNLATPADAVSDLVKAGKAIPVSQLTKVKFSADALDNYFKGLLAQDAHRWTEAVGYLETAIKLNPALEGAYIALGYAYYQQQNFDKEAEAYAAVLKINPKNADVLYSLAWNMESRQRYDEAIPLYEQALVEAPEDKEIIYQLGLTYLSQGKRDKASEMQQRLLRLDPGQAGLLRRLIK